VTKHGRDRDLVVRGPARAMRARHPSGPRRVGTGSSLAGQPSSDPAELPRGRPRDLAAACRRPSSRDGAARIVSPPAGPFLIAAPTSSGRACPLRKVASARRPGGPTEEVLVASNNGQDDRPTSVGVPPEPGAMKLDAVHPLASGRSTSATRAIGCRTTEARSASMPVRRPRASPRCPPPFLRAGLAHGPEAA